jgi:pimeloyl-ACP methyl ester carboxylesterase
MTTSPLRLLGVTPRFLTWRGHQIALHEAGEGPPILLIHSINAAASAHEMRHPFRLLATTHRVIAVDLLGFGDSDRPRMHYTAELYIDLIIHVASQIGQPLTAVAVSLSSAYLLSAAARRPELFRALSVICPTGLEDLVTRHCLPTLGRATRSGHFCGISESAEHRLLFDQHDLRQPGRL